MIIQSTDLTNRAAIQAERPSSIGTPRVHVETTPQAATPQQPSSQALKIAADSINQALKHSNQSLEISIDSVTKQSVFKLMDTQTGELIRQIPSKEMLAIAQSIDEFLKNGQLLREKA